MNKNSKKRNIDINSKQIKPIKKIAGEILLYFYFLQRKNVAELSDAKLSFQLRHFSEDRENTGPKMKQRDKTILNIEKLNKYNDGDLLNALRYLEECNLLNFKESKTNVGCTFFNTKLTARGIDIIEGIERGRAERTQFNNIFNFEINNQITVESLLKAELGALVKASLL